MYWVGVLYTTDVQGYCEAVVNTQFNIFEALEIAERVEGDGARFYLGVAETTEDMELRRECYRLANWKAKHSRVIARRRREYAAKTGEFGTFDPDNYVRSNPHVMAGLAAPSGRLGRGAAPRCSSRTDLFRRAVAREKETAVFYEGLKHFVRDPATEAAVEQVLGEEKRYLHSLVDCAQVQPA